LVNADSTWHGVPGAIMSILNITSIESAIEKGLTHPAEILNDVRTKIISKLVEDGTSNAGYDGMDCAVIILDVENKKMQYASAQIPIYIIRKGEIITLKPEKMPVGKFYLDNVPFVGGEIELLEGDQIYILTDGLQDQFGGPKNKKIKIKPIIDELLAMENLPMKAQAEQIDLLFKSWKGEEEQIDDITVFGFKIL
jgi:serine phosphatase RsbU (regulator of sigma subunit)